MPPPLSLILDALGQLRFAFDELDTLLATLVQIDLTVLCEQQDQLVDRLHLCSTTQALQILCKLFTFLDLAQLLDRIRRLLIPARERKYLCCDLMYIMYAFGELLMGIFGERQVFLMDLDLLVSLLNHLLVSQESLLILLDDVLRVALEQLDL